MDRIERLASLTEGSSTICDIGCDHAYALILAIEKYGVSKGIAADIAQGPLNNATNNIKLHHLEDKIDIVLSNGFERIDFDKFDTAIISGMGGRLIISILEPYLDLLKNKKLILEAHSDLSLLRKFLFDNGFIIGYEDAFYDKKKYYEIMVVTYGSKASDEYDVLYGPYLRRHPNDAYTLKQKNKIELLRNVILEVSEEKKEELKMEQKEIESILKWPLVEKRYILKTKNYYRSYFLDSSKRPTIVVSPGGGYKYTSPRESEPVVEAFSKFGYHVIVVNYRETVDDAYPLPGKYLAAAINEVALDSRVGVIIGLGFSAGGHCLLDVLLHKEFYHLEADMKLLMLGYPVITSDARYAHLGSFKNLLKEQNTNEELLKHVSLELEVTNENAVDLFLWGTVTDESVSVMNSYLLLEAYQKVGANVEYHLFPFGGHGLSVANASSSEGNKEKESPYIARWVELAIEWLNYKLK